MPRDTVSITIERPIEDVFAVLTDVEKTPTWYPAVIEERMTSDGPLGVGSSRISISKSFGIRNENEAVVTSLEPNRAVTIRSISSEVPFEITITFTTSNGDSGVGQAEKLTNDTG